MLELSGDIEPVNAARRARVRRVARPWRIAFAVYALALTTGTHWPRLTLGPEIPATDKLIHMMAFAGLTILLWRTKWFSRRWVVGVVAMVWACADEVSQGIPVLNRTVSWHDVLANGLGVFTALTWLWALGPAGAAHGVFRERGRLRTYIVDEMFARPSAWLAIGGGVIAGSAPLSMMWNAMPKDRIRVAIVIAVCVTTVVTLLLWMRLWRARRDEVFAAMPCLSCGMRSGRMDHVHGGLAQCEICGAAGIPAVWITRGLNKGGTRAGAGASMSLMVKPALIGVAALVAGFGAIFAMPVLYEMVLTQSQSGAPGAGAGARGWLPRVAHVIGTLPPTLTATIDLCAYLVLFAVLVRVYRTGVARFEDRAVRCRRCGHDLRGTPTIEGSGGQGRCGECGTVFMRS